jgi:acyl dehydratase
MSTSAASPERTDVIHAQLEEVRRAGPGAPLAARDPVNLPMINNWVEAMQDANPVYIDESAARAAGFDGPVAPPAMTMVWTMIGLHAKRPANDPLGRAMAVMDEADYGSVVATNCQQTYHRYLRHGEHLTVQRALAEVSGPKQTRLGEGWFLTTRETWYAAAEPVAEMLFRVLKFAPQPAGADDRRPEFADISSEQQTQLPRMTISATPTFIIASAMATRDFEDVHHDRDSAIRRGSRDIFLNILTDLGLVERFVTDWAGPIARIRNIAVRLHVPCYAYDTLEFTGQVSSAKQNETVFVRARGELGDHIVSAVGVTPGVSSRRPVIGRPRPAGEGPASLADELGRRPADERGQANRGILAGHVPHRQPLLNLHPLGQAGCR